MHPEMHIVGVKRLVLDLRGEGIDMAISCSYPLIFNVNLHFVG